MSAAPCATLLRWGAHYIELEEIPSLCESLVNALETLPEQRERAAKNRAVLLANSSRERSIATWGRIFDDLLG
jgi:hypothetical protein